MADCKGSASEVAAVRLPIVVAEWERNRRELVRVQLSEYRDTKTIDVRIWYRPGGDGMPRPGKAGLTLSIRQLPKLAEAMSVALEAARTAHLIDRAD